MYVIRALSALFKEEELQMGWKKLWSLVEEVEESLSVEYFFYRII